MTWLVPIGLAFDLVGVLVLGVDLVGIQRELRANAKRNKESLNSAFKDANYIENVRTNLESGIYGSEGFDGDGGVDTRELDETLKAIKGEVVKLQNGTTDVIEYLFQSVFETDQTARKSLKLSIFGLVLIVVGFTLQIAGYFVSLEAI